MGLAGISPEEITEARADARRLAEDRMLDRIMVERISASSPDIDPDTGLPIESWVQVYPDPTLPIDPDDPYGKARFRVPTANLSVLDATASSPALGLQMQVTLSLPIGAPLLRRGDRVTCMASDDPALVGQRRFVRAEHTGSQLSARRYQLEDVQ